MLVARNWLSKGIGCPTRWLSHAMVVASDACRKELVVARKKVVARNCWSQAIDGRKEGIVVARKELVVARKEMVVARKELVVARNW